MRVQPLVSVILTPQHRKLCYVGLSSVLSLPQRPQHRTNSSKDPHLDETTKFPRFRGYCIDRKIQVLFKQFFATAVMGLGHGLILLPVLLSIVGPASYRQGLQLFRLSCSLRPQHAVCAGLVVSSASTTCLYHALYARLPGLMSDLDVFVRCSVFTLSEAVRRLQHFRSNFASASRFSFL